MKVPKLRAAVANHELRARKMRSALDGSRAADRALCDEYRAVVRLHEDLVTRGDPNAHRKPTVTRLRRLARTSILYLGGEADTWSRSLKDYDHKRYGPYLGVSDEGSAVAAIRRAALDSPKVRAARLRGPMAIGVAHDAERLGAVGEVAVGPIEYVNIRLECTGRILTSTNVGTRLNLRFYKRHPTVTVPAGPSPAAVAATRAQLREAYAPFRDTPDGKPRPLTVYVAFDRDSRRDFRSRASMLRQLARYVASGRIADPAFHRLGFEMRIGFGAKGERAALLAVNLAGAAGVHYLALDGVVSKEGDEMLSLPGLLNYLEPERLQRVLDRANRKRVDLRPKNTVDADTVARSVWTSLLAARRMGLALGKYGLFPLTLEESDTVVGLVQEWFHDWSAAPVFFVDQGILASNRVYVGALLTHGLRRWLRMVASHSVPVVLIDTIDKAKGWRLLKDSNAQSKGLLSARQVRAIDRYASKLRVKVLWAGGITPQQAYQFGAMGVFGIYVTSAAARTLPVSAAYEGDPGLAAMKEPTYEGVSLVKLLLEAGFLAERLKTTALGRAIGSTAQSLLGALRSEKIGESHVATAQRLRRQTVAGWVRHLHRGGARRITKS